MSYATLAQLTDRYGLPTLIALSDRAPVPTGLVGTAVVDRALADADAMIDGYLAGRYALPLAAVPELVRDLACTIAFWRLHTHDPDPKTKADYDQAMRTLRDVSTGLVRIPAAGAEPAGPATDGVQFTDRERPVTPENLTGFI